MKLTYKKQSIEERVYREVCSAVRMVEIPAHRRDEIEKKRIAFVLSDVANRYQYSLYVHTHLALQSLFRSRDGVECGPQFICHARYGSDGRENKRLAAELVAGDYDIIVTCGPLQTMFVAHEKYNERSITNHNHLFTQVENGHFVGAADLLSPHGITGISIEIGSYQEQVDTVLDQRPGATRVVMLCDNASESLNPSILAMSSRGKLLRAFGKRSIQVDTYRITVQDDLSDEILDAIARADILCWPNENAPLVRTEELVALCKKFNTLTVACNLSSILEGASLAWGISGSESSGELARAIWSTCVRGQSVSSLPIERVSAPSEVRYHPDYVQSADSQLSDALIRAIKMRVMRPEKF